MATRRDARKEGRQAHFWMTKEIAERMDKVLAIVPYHISQSALLERGTILALDELERSFPPIAQRAR